MSGVRRALAIVIGLLALVALSTCASSKRSDSKPPARSATATASVTRVVDGDTIAVSVNGRTEKVRLIGIDTPESVKPGTPVQCFAREASDQTKHMLPRGTRVRLERDVDARDRYGRLLAYVYRDGDGLFVNLALVRDGFAVLDTIPPNVAHVDDFITAAADARHRDRGLWSRCGNDVPVHRVAPLPSPP